ncbi:isocitrate lyase/PEP mutase family protein [Cochlodiniinecator piscidefendens]|uniref:isocitrate lyase/PEP mutase family protein n=1 Tax=Cochlodiniinecator piscidefendens TaxID=2715756 RepID=UPI001408CAF2|nr:isocitrate lyase/phosphoenolpyruvate mutase family protein [Cochlodiniinecator piscidefendens]
MPTQFQKAEQFSALHVKGSPVILYNIWDVGSANAVISAGAKALATGSMPVALAHGFTDGEKIPLSAALSNAKRIVDATELPVTMDLEGGYGVEPEKVADAVTQALATGVVGFNFEDQIVGGEGLHPVNLQVTRIQAARRAAEAANIPAFINARTDIFLKEKPEDHTSSMLEEAIVRAKAFEDAGASGFFAPGLKDEAMIERLCSAIELPVNIIALPGAPENARLAELGVARISYGPVPYRGMMAWLEQQASNALNSL